MKVNSVITGKATKRIGNVVMASYGGETIARQYNPEVTNPNTEAQQDTRSRFKLMSQLGAVMSPVIAIRKQGLVSARNKFTKINYPLTSFDGSSATILLNSVQITESNRSFVGFNADRTGNKMVLKLDSDATELYDRVVYTAYRKTDYGDLIPLGDKVVDKPGANGLFEAEMEKTTEATVIYAYGIKAASERLKTKFQNMTAASAERVARLVVSSQENYIDSQITQTAGLTLDVGSNIADSDESRFYVASFKVGNLDITAGVPAGSSITAGGTTVSVVCAGDLSHGARLRLWDATESLVVKTEAFGTQEASMSVTLVAGHRYNIVVAVTDGASAFSPTFDVTAE